MNHNFVKLAAAVPTVAIGRPEANAREILRQAREAESRGARLVSTPELSLTGYTIGDLVQYDELLDAADLALRQLLEESKALNIIIVLGMPVTLQGMLFNAGIAVHRGRVLAVVPKRYIPNYSEFYERRWFASAADTALREVELAGQAGIPFGPDIVIRTPEFAFGIEICEDLWAPTPPSTRLALLGAEVIVNLSASDEVLNKNTYLRQMAAHQTQALMAAYLYSSAGNGESSTDVVFIGKAEIFECGDLLAETRRFDDEPQIITADIDLDRIHAMRMRNSTFHASAAELVATPRVVTCQYTPTEARIERRFEQSPYFSPDIPRDEQCAEMFNIQVSGLTRRMRNAHIGALVLGISGGLDSTLALLVSARAADRLGIPRDRIHAVTMPGYGTSDHTHSNAWQIMRALGVTSAEIPIAQACDLHFSQIGHDPKVHDTTYENTQARQRTFILMNLANKVGGIVVGTGDLSELALGWATYSGDHMSMYGVNAGVPKTLVRAIVEHVAGNTAGLFPDIADAQGFARCLQDIVDTPISPELIPMDGGQKTEDFVGPYPLHDFYIYYTLKYGYKRDKIIMMAERAFSGEYSPETIAKWYDTFWRRFKHQQFKRSCLPDGPKVVSIGISPRGELRLPSDLD